MYNAVTWLAIGLTLSFGFSFLFLSIPKIKELHNYKRARKIMATAYIILAVLYLTELVMHSATPDMELSRIIKLTVGAFQALLFTYTLISLINLHFVTPKKIIMELIPILALSGTLFVFHGLRLRGLGVILDIYILYYLSMLVRYTFLFHKNYWKYNRQVDNFFSEESTAHLRWILYTFIVALLIGIGVLLLTFSENATHYLLFTFLFICFYFYFGIKFLDYAYIFRRIEPAVVETKEKEEESDESLLRQSYVGLEKALALWKEEKKFTKPEITIEQMAVELHTNRTYLSKYINEHEQKSFKEWINSLRIAEAKHLLVDIPEMPVGEVGQRVGYADRSNFGHQFQKYVGATPRAWRLSVLKEQLQNRKF